MAIGYPNNWQVISMLLAYHNQTWFWSPYCPTVGNGDTSIIPSSTLVITTDHGPFIVDVAIEMVIFHSYVSLPEGIPCGDLTYLWTMTHSYPFISMIRLYKWWFSIAVLKLSKGIHMIYLVTHPSEQVDTPVVISRGPVGSVQLGLYFTKWDEPPSRGPKKR